MTSMGWKRYIPTVYQVGTEDMERPEFGEFPYIPSLHWGPNMDVYSDADDLVIKVELPDVRKEEIDIKLEGSQLIISGRHHREDSAERKNYYRRERFTGLFTRRVALPEEVSDEDIEARLKNGVLEVRVKGAGSMAGIKRKIAIDSA